MKEFKPFNKVDPVQTGPRKEAHDPASAVEMFPLLLVSPTVPGAMRDFRPQQVVDPAPVAEREEVEGSNDADPKVVTSSATGSVTGSGEDSAATVLTLHPSSQSPKPESPASAVKDSSESSESLETMNSGFTLPLVLE